MPDLPTSEGLLLLPHIQIQNANAISSSLTWGFPSNIRRKKTPSVEDSKYRRRYIAGI